jgi:hypothetical protein
MMDFNDALRVRASTAEPKITPPVERGEVAEWGGVDIGISRDERAKEGKGNGHVYMREL